MADSKHDELADALARMASGDIAPSDHEPPAPLQPPAPKTARPPTVRPASTRPTAPAAPKPVVPAAPAPPAPAQSTPPRTPRPAAPATGSAPPPTAGTPVKPTVRPIAPALSSTQNAPRKPRPAAPALQQTTVSSTEPEVDGGQSTGLTSQTDDSQIIDDDAVIVPAPDASVFVPKAKPQTSAQARAEIARKKNLEYRRTLIPILLTTGTMCVIFSMLKLFAGADSMLANVPNWEPVIFAVAGVLLLALAGVNMLSVAKSAPVQ